MKESQNRESMLPRTYDEASAVVKRALAMVNPEQTYIGVLEDAIAITKSRIKLLEENLGIVPSETFHQSASANVNSDLAEFERQLSTLNSNLTNKASQPKNKK